MVGIPPTPRRLGGVHRARPVPRPIHSWKTDRALREYCRVERHDITLTGQHAYNTELFGPSARAVVVQNPAGSISSGAFIAWGSPTGPVVPSTVQGSLVLCLTWGLLTAYACSSRRMSTGPGSKVARAEPLVRRTALGQQGDHTGAAQRCSACHPLTNAREGMAMTIVDPARAVTGGVDTHLDLNVAAAVDAIGAGGRIALAGFLAGYRGWTRDAYALDLRQFVGWCERHGLKLFAPAVPT